VKHTLVLSALLLAAVPVLAHDMWLVPPVSAAVGEPVEIGISVGMDFPTSSTSIAPERVSASALGPGGARAEVALTEQPDRDRTVANFTPDKPGTWLVAATTRPNFLAMEADRFNHYLIHDGLAHVLHERMDLGEMGEDSREQYSKYVKALVSVGEGGGSRALDRVGHKLEIVPLADPLAVRVGDTLEVQVFFEGAPLAHANVCWDHPGNGEDFSGQTWTDVQGKTLVPIAKSGPTTLRLIHMTRPRTADYEWESFWSSFTFHVAEN